ncbi:ABC transporter substrate-binding protein [Pragia fontium]|uniref:Phosphoglycerate transport regulatory protein PgtC n=1 Tax=Pragia fontium DSM 5563 = ATCC 49100 TaxID=1122977 RepID=A0AAJ4W9Y3_9GAMM|nr:ABC transporter substrate-binding protein [Pragia fontium]SFC65010.1 phosphoglycerate transport regulatory protein PgtC [Pragia fontium DSM 5563 = ATCC 49100]VEJ56503.1 Phosphoglycerate transport regulatory protein pgtC precursor [Pragia fontium]
MLRWHLLILLLTSALAHSSELVIATTLSPEATEHIIGQWQTQPQAVSIRTLNRTSSSLERLLNNPLGEKIDLVLSSSPMLMQRLQDGGKLSLFENKIEDSRRLVPESIRSTTVAVAISGYGILVNRTRLQEKGLPTPKTWEDLGDARYQGMILMSSPSRSDTTHLMIESLLEQRGWQQGWASLLQVSGNLATISSRSFGVANKINTGLGAAGPVIDNYANVLLNSPNLSFNYFPTSRAAPMFIAITHTSTNQSEAGRFITFLLSPSGQQAMSDSDSGKYPVYPLPPNHPMAHQQSLLLEHPPLNYPLTIQRQKLVQLLFDSAITFRLTQLQDAWKALNQAELNLKRPLPEIRALLTQVPVSAEQAADPQYLSQLEQQPDFRESQLMAWQQFFLQQQRLAIKQLEALK